MAAAAVLTGAVCAGALCGRAAGAAGAAVSFPDGTIESGAFASAADVGLEGRGADDVASCASDWSARIATVWIFLVVGAAGAATAADGAGWLCAVGPASVGGGVGTEPVGADAAAPAEGCTANPAAPAAGAPPMPPIG